MKTGWEITPLGWVVLIIIIGTALYFVLFKDTEKERNISNKDNYS